MDTLNKQQFLEAVKDDPSMILQCDMRDDMIFFSRCSELFTMDEYKDLCKQHIHDFEAYSALIDYSVQSSNEDTINAVSREIAYENFLANKPPQGSPSRPSIGIFSTNGQTFDFAKEYNELLSKTDEQGITSVPFKKGKVSYLSNPDIVPRKTGVPREWIENLEKKYLSKQ